MQIAITKRLTYGDLFLVEGLVPAAVAGDLASLEVEGAEHSRVEYPGDGSAQGGNLTFRISGLAAPGGANDLRMQIAWRDGRRQSWDADDMMAAAIDGTMGDLTARLFVARLHLDQAAGRRPRVLDVGGRKRTGINDIRRQLGEIDLVIADLLPAEEVDIVGDAHRLSTLLPPASIDYVLSTSVFEHLMMPWKVALEINAVLRPGGCCLITSHQTIGMHELPADYWRFSDNAWRVLFSPASGFEVIATAMGETVAVAPHLRPPLNRDGERAVGFENSSVLARKIGNPQAKWKVEPETLGLDRYPV